MNSITDTSKAPSALIQAAKFCKDYSFGEKTQIAESPPFGISAYVLDERNANTIHFFLSPKSETLKFDYMVFMVLSDQGLPCGHFHYIPCEKRKPFYSTGKEIFQQVCTNNTDNKWGVRT